MGRLGNLIDLIFSYNIYGADVNVITPLWVKGYKYNY